MRLLSLAAAAALTLSLVGCGQKTEVTGEGGKKLTLTVPNSATVKQGDTATFTIAVKREKFEDDVKLTFSQLPDGVKVEETDPKIDKGNSEATFHLVADTKAKAEQGHQVKVSASAAGMKAGPQEFTVNVKENKK